MRMYGLLFATGNNIRALGDMVRRTLECHLDAKTERPEQRSFEFDPIKRVLDNRGTYIAAAITISRAYQVGRQVEAHQRPAAGGLRRLVQGGARAINLAGRARPGVQHGGGAGGRPTACGCAWIGTPLGKCIGTGVAVTARVVIATANKAGFPKFRAFLIEHAGTMKGDQIDPVRLGKWLHKEHGRVYGGFRIDIVPHKGRGNQYVLTEIQEEGC